jgi:hypothetical protein
VENVAHMGEMKNVYKIFIEKAEGKISLRHKHGCEINIKIDLTEIKLEGETHPHVSLSRPS